MASETSVGKVNLNRATLGELRSLPGIGRVRARAIVQYREEHGPFQDVEALRSVEGIAEGVFEAIRDLVTVEDVPSEPSEAARWEVPVLPAAAEPVESEPEAAIPVPPPATERPKAAIGAEAPSPKAPAEPVIEEVEAKAQPQQGRFWKDLLLVLLGALLGTGLTLLILYAVNGTLFYARQADAVALEVQTGHLQEQQETAFRRLAEAERRLERMEEEVAHIPALRSELGELRKQAADLETAFGALKAAQSALEREQASLQSEVNTLVTQTDQLAERTEKAEARLTSLEKAHGRLVRFLTALKDLLQETLAPLTEK